MKGNKKETIPRFTVPVRTAVMALVLVICIGVLSVVNYYNLRNQTDIESVDSLSGQRVGCCVGWETDYLLTPRDDITLLRYETNATAVTALGYGQVDAIGLDEITAGSVLAVTEGLEMFPDPIASIGLTLYVSNESGEKLENFNRFAKDFKQQDCYEDYHRRCIESTGYFEMEDIPEVPASEAKDTIKVAYLPDSYPSSYIDASTKKPAGYAIEAIERFAYEYGYAIEFIESSDSDASMRIRSNDVDFIASGSSDIYREEVEASGACKMSESYFDCGVFIVKVKDGEKLKITGSMSN